ncbi:hypothetical protein DSO57_1024277 [Entomophthora muscae]|uniref:Uncharacterized protein n=1 Tax=Entomophthora muscae TaxID=34485 RepID=A0ACC2RTR6_9FUNG|nr:hypothetical protein DSO57_1024277 [Entomophthora muscae]
MRGRKSIPTALLGGMLAGSVGRKVGGIDCQCKVHGGVEGIELNANSVTKNVKLQCE